VTVVTSQNTKHVLSFYRSLSTNQGVGVLYLYSPPNNRIDTKPIRIRGVATNLGYANHGEQLPNPRRSITGRPSNQDLSGQLSLWPTVGLVIISLTVPDFAAAGAA
jgi:hypothetical protein